MEEKIRKAVSVFSEALQERGGAIRMCISRAEKKKVRSERSLKGGK